MNDILCRQLSLDFCCTGDEVRDDSNHFTVFRPLEGRRRYKAEDDCLVKVAVVNGKLLFTGREDFVGKCEERYAKTGGAWFFEMNDLRAFDALLGEAGAQIKFVHPFYIPGAPSEPRPCGYDIRWYEQDDIERFRGDERYREALGFCETAPDMIAVTAERDGEIVGMAGVSADSPTMWQIGINVEPAAQRSGVGTALVTMLKNEVLRRGKLPFYGTSMSHIASQRVAHGSGFVPAWAELAVRSVG